MTVQICRHLTKVLEFYSENFARLMLNPFSIYFSLFVLFLWCRSLSESEKSLNVFKKLSVSYIALKKIVGCPKYFSNHLVCNFLSTRTFEHFINVKCFKFSRRLCINNSSCFNRVQQFKRHSNFRLFLENIFLQIWCAWYLREWFWCYFSQS